MSNTTNSCRRRRIFVGAIAASATTGLGFALAAQAGAAPANNAAGQTDAVVAFFQAHPGVMPNVQQQQHINAYKAAHPNAATTATATVSANTLAFGGGTNGIGVMSGAKTKVYLVFYGNQWGTQSTDANGDAKFSGDADGAASAAQEMYKGIGTNNELWSADLTQWCDGSGVSTGATSCPSTLPASQFVPYQSGGVLAGVWYDNSAASPSQATEDQLGQESVNAAAHFNNTTAASNRNTYYVILSPHGTNPDNYKGLNGGQGYCAWHMDTSYPQMTGGPVKSPYGDLAFSNQPYNMDMGQSCGVGFVNGTTSGTLDGYTITLGHEWHEMMSDVDPNTGWSNPGTNGGTAGYENSDECAWIQPGQTGGAANIKFGTGTFAEQSSWSNDTDSCAISHQIVDHGGSQGNTVTVTNPGNQSGTVGTAASVQINASDSASGQTLSYSASGLPAGLSINSSTGLISGTPTTAATSNVTVTVKDTTGASGSTSFSWTIAGQGTGGTVTVTNPGAQIWFTQYAFGPLQIKASDSKSLPLTFTATGLPPGLTISTSGVISGTATAGGDYTVKVTAKDSGGSTGTTSFAFTIYAI